MKKIIGIFMIGSGVSLGIFFVVMAIVSHYQYDTDFASNWSLADKASTLSQKSEYIDKFVDALGNSALV